MKGKNWIRIVICGWVVGVVWFALPALSLSFFGEDVQALVQEGGPHAKWDGGFLFGIDVIMGIWTMWLYSAIAPTYGAGVKSAVIVGVAWWAMKSLQSAKWIGLGFASSDGLLIPLAATLIFMVVASGIGVWIYERIDMPAQRV